MDDAEACRSKENEACPLSGTALEMSNREELEPENHKFRVEVTPIMIIWGYGERTEDYSKAANAKRGQVRGYKRSNPVWTCFPLTRVVALEAQSKELRSFLRRLR
jgi:hypothetical protein